ncbi:MAG: hypothetical protein ABR562_07055, partial [Thermoplasmatota archaeon]
NFVNAPLLRIKLSQPYDVDMAERATGNITLRALFFFRWGAMSTLLFGLLLLGAEGQAHGGMGNYFLHNGWPGYAILMGGLLAVAMWFNVWFIIWPNQKVILGNNKRIAGGVADDEKARLQAANAPRVKKAVMASRVNTWFSVPMLFGMVFGAHGPAQVGSGMTVWYVSVGAVALLLLVMAMLSQKPKK